MEFQLSLARLRPWRLEDEQALARHADNRNVWRNLRDGFPHPYTLADAREYISHYAGRSEAPGFAIDLAGEAVGSIALHPQQDVARLSAELGYWLAEPYWNQGIMTEAVKAVTHFGLSQLGFIRIYAQPFEWNQASMRVLEKAGYTFEGRHRKAVTKDGQTIDEFVYAILHNDLRSDPA
jgi:RimJ/RimL family protein N-acetyltransferase